MQVKLSFRVSISYRKQAKLVIVEAIYGLCSKLLNTFIFLFSLVIRAGIRQMLVRIATSEDHDQTASAMFV